MSEVSYRPLIEEMVWSYSRIKSFDDCPYRFFLKYIKKYEDEDKFYASYGTFMHKLIEQFYKGEITKEEMNIKFLFDFQKEVKGLRPKESTVEKYIRCGSEYLNSFTPFPYKMVDVEKEVKFEIDGIPFVGFIDYLGEKDGEFYIVDNKSRDLKPRSGRKKPTVKDIELDDMLRQLYLYSAAIKQEYGKYPKSLCFNCFKSGVFIEEPFDEEAFDKACNWAKEKIEEISETGDFYPNQDFFSCLYICGVRNHCIYDE